MTGHLKSAATAANLLIAAFFCIVFPVSATASSASSGDASIKSITVVCDDNYPPYVFREPDGKLRGITVDQWELWSKKTGIPVKINAMEWSLAQRDMAEGKADVIDTIFFTEDRNRIYDFTPAYASIDVPVFFSSEISGISDPESLGGFVVAVKTGDSCINVLRMHGVDILEEFPDYISIINGAVKGKVKIFCMDRPPAIYLLDRAGIRNNFRMTAPVYTGNFHRAVKKGSQELLKIINAGFSKISKKEYADIGRKWSGENIDGYIFMRNFIIVFIIAAAAVLLLFLWNITLVNRVNGKTRDLKRAMEVIQQSEQKFRLAFDTSPDAININRMSDGMYLEINDGFTRLTGFTKENVAGKTSEEIKIWNDMADRKKLVDGLRARGFVDNLEAVFRGKDGSTKTALMSAKIMMIKGEPNILSITRDISERKKLEISIAESEEKFRTLAEQSLIGIVIIQDNVFKYVNRVMENLIGFSRSEILKWEPMEFMKTVSPEFHDLVFEQIKKKQAGGGDVRNVYEFKLLAKDGKERWVSIYSKTITYDGRRAILVSLADISDIKETHDRLEKTIEKLKTSNDELEKFAFATSHDLQEPLRMVSNYLQLLRAKYHGRLDAEAEEYIDTAVKGAVRMAELIRGILDLSRIGKVEMNFQGVNTGEIVEEVKKMLGPKIIETGAEITAGEMPEIMADKTQMTQLFMNLIGNSIKFSAAAGKPKIEITCSKRNNYWLFCVKDNGIGISPKYFDRIFVAFQTLHSKDEYEGSGIGLATCKKIVEYHNGKIWVESEEGKGAAFYFTIAMNRA